jgi:uncharacterized protein (DUF1778 family)
MDEQKTIVLSATDRDRFLELLGSPPQPNEALRRTAQRHRELIARSEATDGLPPVGKL